jgi:hypothetical protein
MSVERCSRRELTLRRRSSDGKEASDGRGGVAS